MGVDDMMRSILANATATARSTTTAATTMIRPAVAQPLHHHLHARPMGAIFVSTGNINASAIAFASYSAIAVMTMIRLAGMSWSFESHALGDEAVFSTMASQDQ